MTTVFVTGANGFLGATLVRILLETGYRVRGLVRAGANDLLLQNLPLERVTGDLLQPESYRHALSGCEGLFHVAAAYTHDPQAIPSMEAINHRGTRLVLTAALEAGVPRLLHTSTIGTIGLPSDGSPATEDIPFNVDHPTAYVRSKLAGEREAEALAREGAHIVIVHPTAMLGPGDWRPSNSGRFVLDVLHGRTPPYPPGGINWCPVQDIARGMILALERGQSGRHYILGHRRGNLLYSDFLGLLGEALGHPLVHSRTPGSIATRARAWLRRLRRPSRPDRASGSAPARLTADPTRAIRELGMPQSDLLAAARAEIAWYRQHGYL